MSENSTVVAAVKQIALIGTCSPEWTLEIHRENGSPPSRANCFKVSTSAITVHHESLYGPNLSTAGRIVGKRAR